MSAARDAEQMRQQHLLAALKPAAAGPVPAAARLAGNPQHGLRAYRVNAQATAERALGAVFPTVAALLGPAAFAAVARDHWRDAPPGRGDLGAAGVALPAWLDAQPALADWPWLGDCARLDLALHACERAADAVFDAASLQALADTDPARLRLVLRPGVALIESRWPLALLHAAHRDNDDGSAADGAFAAARSALAAGQGGAVCVARRGWRAEVHAVDAAALPGWRALIAGRDLATALTLAGPGFDFGDWLAQALAAEALQGLVTIDD